jgi:hypothetical protein
VKHIGIDYDDTFSADPAFWKDVLALAERHGHRCYIVTCRRDTDENREEIGPDQTGLPRHRHYFTGLSPKRHYMESRGIKIDWWMDDLPESVIHGR